MIAACAMTNTFEIRRPGVAENAGLFERAVRAWRAHPDDAESDQEPMSVAPVFQPAVGDNLNFYGPVLDAEVGAGPFAAVVTKVYAGSRIVDLTIFLAGHGPRYVTAVLPIDQAKADGRYWTELPL